MVAALEAHGLRAEGRDEPAGARSRFDVVVWQPPPAAVAAADAKLVATLCETADRVLVVAGGPPAPWAARFVSAGFYHDAEAGAGLSGVLTFRKAPASAEVEGLRREIRRRIEQIDGLYRLLDEKERTITALSRGLNGLQATLGWRALERFRTVRARALEVPGLRESYRIFRRAVEVLLEEGLTEGVLKTRHKLALALRGRNFLVTERQRAPKDVNDQYQLWLERQRRSPLDRREAQAALDRLATGPVVSLLAVSNTVEAGLLTSALESLRTQRYPRWELCVAMPAPIRAVAQSELEALESIDARLHLASASAGRAGLADALRVATGEIVGVLDLHDQLDTDALLELVRRLDEQPDLDAVYSDEDILDAGGRRTDPFFKPEWSPDLLLATAYVSRLGLVRRGLVDAIGGMRPEMDDGAAYDLWLRVGERAGAIARVPKVLYHRRTSVATVAGLAAQEQTREMERRAVEDALRRRGLEGSVEALPAPFGAPAAFAPRPRLRGRPLVSIIIPTRDKLHLLEQTIQSIRERTEYDHYEVVVVDNDSREPETLKYLDALAPPCRTLRWRGAFNFSAINNAGAQHAKGEQLLFLNNDVEILRGGWLAAMLEHAQREDVGAVGAKLLYPDGRIQHAGVVVGVGGLAVHAFRLWPAEPTGPLRLADVLRNCSAVTAACMMVRRGVFDEAGGFDERLRVVFNDVDLCLRIRRAGYRIVYTPLALLTHYEGASRGRLHPIQEEKLFRQRWAEVLGGVDPYYNPNLTATRDDWSLILDDDERHDR